MMMNPDHHQTGELESFLGGTIDNSSGEAALESALDIIANHPNVGPFLAEQFIKRLVTSNPSRGYVGRVARVFNDDGLGVRGNLRAVFKAVLLDRESLENCTGEHLPRLPWPGLREPMVSIYSVGQNV